jgi:hypothetical protein
MAHTFLGEQRPGELSLRSSGGAPVLDETYHHAVYADSALADRLSILATTGVPIPGQTVSSWGYALCKSVKAVRRPEQVRYWDITSEFSSDVDDRQSSQDPRTDPVAWIPVYETKFERLQEIVTKDESEVSVANSAGQPFENGIIRARFIPIWEFYQFEAASVTDETVIARNETVNNATFKGRAAKTLLCTVMSSVIGYYYGARRRLTRYSLRYNVKTFITFQPFDVVPGIGSICDAVVATVLSAECGSGLQIGDEVNVWDRSRSWFAMPEDLLFASSGNAHYMKVSDEERYNLGDLDPGPCRWEVVNMNCIEDDSEVV